MYIVSVSLKTGLNLVRFVCIANDTSKLQYVLIDIPGDPCTSYSTPTTFTKSSYVFTSDIESTPSWSIKISLSTLVCKSYLYIYELKKQYINVMAVTG